MTTTPSVPADDGALVIEVVADDGCVRVVVCGDLDIDTDDVFDGGVEQARRSGTPLLIDLRRTGFLGARGIAAIVRAGRLLGGGLGPITVVVARDTQRRSLEVTGIARIVRVEHDVGGSG